MKLATEFPIIMRSSVPVSNTDEWWEKMLKKNACGNKASLHVLLAAWDDAC